MDRRGVRPRGVRLGHRVPDAFWPVRGQTVQQRHAQIIGTPRQGTADRQVDVGHVGDELVSRQRNDPVGGFAFDLDSVVVPLGFHRAVVLAEIKDFIQVSYNFV